MYIPVDFSGCSHNLCGIHKLYTYVHMYILHVCSYVLQYITCYETLKIYVSTVYVLVHMCIIVDRRLEDSHNSCYNISVSTQVIKYVYSQQMKATTGNITIKVIKHTKLFFSGQERYSAIQFMWTIK